MPLVSARSGSPISQRTTPPTTIASLVQRTVSIERISVHLDQLGPLPSIALEVVNLTNSPDSDAAQLEAKISQDPIITAKVFKLANSTFYCKGNPSQTLRDAGTRLGMKTIKNLVLSSCAGEMMAKPLKHYAYEGYGMWLHSLAVALTSMQMTRELGLSIGKRDDLFLAGMMHDIGKLIVDPLLGDNVQRTGSANIALEEKFLGMNHSQMGVEIAQRWNLPEVAVDVIQHHHAPDGAESNADLVAAIHLVDSILNSNHIGLHEDIEVDEHISPAALEALSLGVDDFEALQFQVAERLPEIMDLCNNIA